MLQPARVSVLPTAATASHVIASEIAPLGHAEAARVAAAELERFVELCASLAAEDWTKPTVCTLWNVHDVVAHVAGECASYASWSEFRRQNSPANQRPYRQRGMLLLDSLNQFMVDDRTSMKPEELITELQRAGPRAIRTRSRLPLLLRAIRLPLPGLGGWVRIDYLTDLIYTRDMWMHRLDICRATGRTMQQNGEHDGRMVALMVRDLDRKLRRAGTLPTLDLELQGAAGGRWRIGPAGDPATTIRIDLLDWAWLVAGRTSPAEALAAATIDGDRAVAEQLFADTQIPF